MEYMGSPFVTIYELWINVAKSGSAQQLFVKSSNMKFK